MLCSRSARKLILCLTHSDFQFGDWKNFLADLKHHIPASEREYDEELRQWYIKATKRNESIVKQLSESYFSGDLESFFH